MAARDVAGAAPAAPAGPGMSADQVLAVYEAMAALSGQMLAAANGSDWQRLSQLEQRCAALVARLKQGEPVDALDQVKLQRKAALLTQLMADDRRIRDLTEPWMKHLTALLSNTSTERRLANAYRRA